MAERNRQPRKDPDRDRGVVVPPVNAAVRVFLPAVEGDAVASRVEDIRGTAIVLSAPTVAGGRPLRVDAGETVLLEWASERGMHQLLVTVEKATSGPAPSWTLSPCSPPTIRQRREGFRVPLRRTVRLRVADRQVEAELLDLSEGGLSCRLPGQPRLRIGQVVGTTVVLDRTDEPLVTNAAVVRVLPRSRGDQEAALRFTELTRADVTRLRRFLLAEQVRHRAITRAWW